MPEIQEKLDTQHSLYISVDKADSLIYILSCAAFIALLKSKQGDAVVIAQIQPVSYV